MKKLNKQIKLNKERFMKNYLEEPFGKNGFQNSSQNFYFRSLARNCQDLQKQKF